MAILCLFVGGFLGVVLMSLLSTSDTSSPYIEFAKADIVYTEDIREEIQKAIDFYKNSTPTDDYTRGCDDGAIAALDMISQKIDVHTKHTDVVTNID